MVDQNSNVDTLINLTERILSELELLTSTTKAEALAKFQTDFLGTEQKRKIYDAIDGEKDSQALSEVVDCSLRSVQAFIKDLQEKDLIDFSKNGKAIIPRKAISKIATYYTHLNIINAGGNENG